MKFTLIISDQIKNNIMNEDREICANLKRDEHSRLFVDPNSIVYGESPEIGGRASCSFKGYSSIIFHTHPRTSYSIPSVEDILKVFKHKGIKTSVIMTNWGIFQIIKYKEHNIDFLRDKIEEIINTINKNTVNPEYRKYRGTSRAKGLTKNIEYDLLPNNVKESIQDYFQIINIGLNGNGEILFRSPFISMY